MIFALWWTLPVHPIATSSSNVIFLSKSKLEIAVKDEELETVINVIQQAAKTDQIGDGKIFVTDLSKVIRIRTGETGPSAI